MTDVTALINHILGTATYPTDVCDLNADGTIDVTDVTTLITHHPQIILPPPAAALFLLCDRFFSIFWIKRKIISKFGEINNGNMDTQRLLKYTAAVISEFSLAHNLTLAQAFRYLKRYKGIEFVKRHYEVEHTLSFDDVVDDLTTYCKRMGGRLV